MAVWHSRSALKAPGGRFPNNVRCAGMLLAANGLHRNFNFAQFLCANPAVLPDINFQNTMLNKN
jgi:hypothetical protein